MDEGQVAGAAEAVVRLIEITGQIEQTRVKGEQRLVHAASSPSRRVAFSAVGDNCPLCQSLDGLVFRADSPEAARYTPPLHINCNCIWVEVLDGEEGENLEWSPAVEGQLAELVEQHGHFVAHPERYAELKVPARPDGRDFTVRRARTGEPARIEWTRPAYDLERVPWRDLGDAE